MVPAKNIKHYLENLEYLATMAGGNFATVGVLGQQFPQVADMLLLTYLQLTMLLQQPLLLRHA